MHCHLGFSTQANEVAQTARARGLSLFSASVSPADYASTRELLGGEPNVYVALGMHPWWIADGSCGEHDVELFEELVDDTRWVGEVGLDFSPKRGDLTSRDVQLGVFRDLCRAAAGSTSGPPKVISLHSVQAAGACLDTLGETGCLERCRCVFHWFSGSSGELHRAVQAGCWFSVNERMVATRRGREYVRQIPQDRLLLETDLPSRPGEAISTEALLGSLERTLKEVAALRNAREDDFGEALRANSLGLLAQ